MADYMVRIVDQNGKSFKVSITTYPGGAKWQSLDKGFIRYHNGKNAYSPSHGTLTSYHLHFNCTEDESGLRLNDWFDILGVNDGGQGHVAQSWVLGLAPGRISWYVMSGEKSIFGY